MSFIHKDLKVTCLVMSSSICHFFILFIDKLSVFKHCHLHFGGGYVGFLCLFCNLPNFHLMCSYIFSPQCLPFFSSLAYLLLSFHVLAALCCTCLACLHSASVVLTLVGKSFRIKGKWAVQSSKGRVETVARLSKSNKITIKSWRHMAKDPLSVPDCKE